MLRDDDVTGRLEMLDEDDQLSWVPSAAISRRSVQLPLNLRSSSVSSMSSMQANHSYSTRSSRISSIFSTDSNKDDEDDPFELKKLNKGSKKSSTGTVGPGPVGLLVQIDSESPTSSQERSDLGSKLQMALESYREDSVIGGDSLLSLKMSGSDGGSFELSRPENDLNNAFTDWDRLEDEAIAIAGEIKLADGKPKTPKSGRPSKTPNLLNETKKFDVSSFSPGLWQSPLVPLDDSDLKFRLVDISPDLIPAKTFNFVNDGRTSGPAKKKLPFSSMQPAMKPNVISSGSQSSSTKSAKSSTADVFSFKSLASRKESKENVQPNLINFELQDEVFIDDQLEKMIKAATTRPKSSATDSSLSQSSQFGPTSFATPSRCNSGSSSNLSRRPTASSSIANSSNTSIREKSLVSSTPLVSTKDKLSLFAPLRTGLATPIKSVYQHHFATPQTGLARRSPIMLVAKSGTSKKDGPAKSRHSMATPLPPQSPLRSSYTSTRITPSKTSQTSRYSIAHASPMNKQTPIKSYVRTEKPAHSKIGSSPRASQSLRAPQTPVTSSYAQPKMTPSRPSIATPASQSIAKVTRSLYGTAVTASHMRTPQIGNPLISNRTLETPLKTPFMRGNFLNGHGTVETPLKTPLVVGKPPMGDRNTGSKLQFMKQGPILRSKMSLSAQHSKPIPESSSTRTPGFQGSLLARASSDGTKKSGLVPPKYVNNSATRIPPKC